jgi:hypothetical protein
MDITIRHRESSNNFIEIMTMENKLPGKNKNFIVNNKIGSSYDREN